MRLIVDGVEGAHRFSLDVVPGMFRGLCLSISVVAKIELGFCQECLNLLWRDRHCPLCWVEFGRYLRNYPV